MVSATSEGAVLAVLEEGQLPAERPLGSQGQGYGHSTRYQYAGATVLGHGQG